MASLQHWTCLSCDKVCSRKPVRGQRPKYCSEDCRVAFNYERAKAWTRELRYICVGCNLQYVPSDYRDKYCGQACFHKYGRPIAEPKFTLSEPVNTRSPIGRAYEGKDYPALLEAIKADTVRVDDCWEWARSFDSDGYPRLRLGKKQFAVHRMAVEAYHEKPLGTQQAHHSCANTKCVNPLHVIPVTASENVAEMKARQSYLARIEELEAALAELAPSHPALGVLELY